MMLPLLHLATSRTVPVLLAARTTLNRNLPATSTLILCAAIVKLFQKIRVKGFAQPKFEKVLLGN